MESVCGKLSLLVVGLDSLFIESFRFKEGLWGYVD